MSEMHLSQPGITYSACEPFTRKEERWQKFKETGDSRYIYWNELDKACFEHDMAYGDFEGLARKLTFNKILSNIAFNVATNPKYDGYQCGLAGGAVKSETKSNQELAGEIHKPIIRKIEKQKYTHLLKIIFGICNKMNNAIKIRN